MTETVRRGLALIAIAGLLVACSTPAASTVATGSIAAPSAAGASAAGASAAGASAGGGASIAATLKEWQISLSSTTPSAGKITFNITNSGDKEHEFVVRKTDLQSDKLPLNADGEVSEDATELTEVGDPSEVAEIAAGSTDKSLTVTLQPGHYVIFCNLHVEELLHYDKGMHVDFTVN
jgi:uncharacterized cupredoxin-like copper-binding protein